MSNRRDFLKSLTGVTVGLAVTRNVHANEKQKDKIGEILPQRNLGKTGRQVTMLGVGGYHIGWTTERDAHEVIEAALEGGVRFFDTAESYQKGTSELRYGKYLVPKFRKNVFIMTKSTARTAKQMQQHLEGSLKRLKVDSIDLYQIHSLQNPEDAENRVNNGILDVLIKAKQQGKVKHVGLTGHQNPYALLKMMELAKDTDLLETVQMPVNLLDQSYFSFTKNVMPVALEQEMGILAMKTLADGRFFAKKEQANWTSADPVIPNYVTIKEAQHFAWSLPISVLITGAENATFLREKIELAKSFVKIPQEKREELVEKVREIALSKKVEYFKKEPV